MDKEWEYQLALDQGRLAYYREDIDHIPKNNPYGGEERKALGLDVMIEKELWEMFEKGYTYEANRN
jgi:hypothetical protein